MNPGLVVKLRPSGPWRIGPDSGARNRVDVIYHSDSLYSAVTAAMSRLGWLEEWLDATARTAESAVSFGSCFPYMDEIGFVVPPRTVWPPVSPSARAAKVRWKSARFVPLTVVQSILAGRRLDENQWSVDGPSDCLVPAGRSGPFRTAVRWSAGVDRLTGVTERHSTACLEFRPGSGLWTVVSFQNEEAQARWAGPVKGAFRLLADTGFGGERSRGWGRSEAPEFTEGMLPDLILPPNSEAVETTATPSEEDSPGRAATVRERSPVAPMVVVPATPGAEPLPVAEAPAIEPVPVAELEAPAAEAVAVPEIPADAATPAPEPSAIEPEAPTSEAVAVPAPPADAATPAREPSAIEPEAPAAEAVAIPEIPADAATPAPEPSAIEPEAPVAEAVAIPETPADAATPAPEPCATGPEAPAAEAVAVPETPGDAATPAPEPSAIEPEAPAAGAVAVAEIPADAAPTAPEPSAIEPEALAAGAVAVPEIPADAETPAPEPSPIEPEAPVAEAVAVAEIPADAAPTAPEPSAIEPEALAAGAVAVPEIPADAAPPAPETSVIEPVPAPEAPAVPTHPHWLLSVFTPAPADLVDWRRGNYTVLARSGRVDSPAGSGELKKQIHMVAEGSVVYAEAPPRGSAANVAPDGFAHPVFRAGFALAIPLPEVS